MTWPPRDEPAWSEPAEQEVRPYAVTGGRTTPRHQLRLVSTLAAGREPTRAPAPEAAQALALCRRQPCSVAEIAALLHQPVLVTKVLLSDLLDAGALVMAVPHDNPDPQDPALLEAIHVGLRVKFNL